MEYSGYGAATGKASAANTYADVEAAYDYLVSRGVSPKRSGASPGFATFSDGFGCFFAEIEASSSVFAGFSAIFIDFH